MTKVLGGHSAAAVIGPWLACLCCASLGGGTAKASPPRAVAVVVGVNSPSSPEDRPLRFGDDDAVKTTELLRQAGVEVVILTTPDLETERFLGDRIVNPQHATRSALDKAFATLAANKAPISDFYFFYSGHGGLDGEQAYVTLEDGRLSRDALQLLIHSIPATRKHVILDSCKSYFMAFSRGPGGKKTRLSVPWHDVRDDNVGFVLSTSSDRDSHEWSRYQSGVFSHEVRSALRGAADANGDGNVDYVELYAFVDAANASITNPSYRPEVFVLPPAQSRGRTALLSWQHGDPKSVVVIDGAEEHWAIEDHTGVRLLDVHPDQTLALRVHLPPSRPLFARAEARGVERVVEGPGPIRLSELSDRNATVERKGAQSLAFRKLFQTPFDSGRIARSETTLRQNRTRFNAAPPRAGGVTLAGASDAGPPWTVIGLTGLAATVGLVAAGVSVAGLSYDFTASTSKNGRWDTVDLVGPVSAGVGVVLLGGAAALAGTATWWALDETSSFSQPQQATP